MAKPTVFISSTFYDLKYIRTEIDQFIENLGYQPVRNEEGDIPYGKEEALEEYCYKEIQNIDILISIIGGRFGSESKKTKEKSISHLELKYALEENKQVYIFIEKNVNAEYETYLLNKENDIKFKHVDDVRIYKFIEEIKLLPNNNNIKNFETSSDIINYLKDQFAGLFQRFMQNQSRIKEISLINKLETTSKTLDQLVNYLSDENKENTEEINRILMIHHPLVEELKNKLDIKYLFYIQELSDLEELLKARGYKDAGEKDDYFLWNKKIRDKIKTLGVSKSLFDIDDKLKFLKKGDWKVNYVSVNIEEEDDDLPF
ncbi:DUF4062 domain-containing protein [Apibacter muscae]|uniref:DUF4062 domain-containing protein n=1 Tax=Apibacter muscae TaxID=2509004 RepID=UPI0011AC92C3|nr:DUF4062 domain-containing protein [Apibacter muscae]TWP24278.1 DUF4062 domain-containing protein [Apibacter muscae]TWP30161.1 DUF4062 domain-containing protein [Apibacter muscae]